MCRKQSFATPEAAERQMRRIPTRGNSAHVYQCPTCSQWHWGHADVADKAFAMASFAHGAAKWPPRVARRG